MAGHRRGAVVKRLSAVETLGSALEGVALSAIARAFAELSDVARQLANQIELVYSQTAARRQAS